jgi:hypothetical protein
MNALCAAILLTAAQDNDPFESRRPELREKFLERGGGSKETEAAVRKALAWLARNQRADHSWKTPEEDYTIGVTALSVLAFLGAGHPPNSTEFGDPIRRALQYLVAAQDVEGCVGLRGAKYIYSHIVATLALAEAHGMSSPELYAKPAQKAVDFLIASQNPGRGWRYSKKCGDNDTSVTGWAVMALRSAERVGLRFPKAAWEGALAWFDAATLLTGRTDYYEKGTSDRFMIPGPEAEFELHETMTAMAILGRYLIQKRRNEPRLSPGLDLVAKDLPRWEKNSLDYCYWHIATLAMFEAGGAEGARWKTWNAALQKALLGHQVAEGEQAGTWEPVDRWCFEGARACSTAMNALTLETYYRNVRIFRGDEK